MESLKTNAEILNNARTWVAEVKKNLSEDSSHKTAILSPFLEPWTLAVTISILIENNLRWRSIAPNDSPRMQCLQVAHENNLLDWPVPDQSIILVKPDNIFSPPSRSDMLETLLEYFSGEISFGDVYKIDKGWAVCIANSGEFPEKIPGLSIELLPAEQTRDFPPATQSGMKNASVSSPRIDAVTAKALKPSREQVKKHIASGGVLLNYKQIKKPGLELVPGDIVTVRGGGRFRLDSIGATTKKGRIIINVEILNGP